MSESKNSASTTTLTEREMKLLSSVFQCLDAPPAPDLAKLAALESYKTAASARTAWINLRKKLGIPGVAETAGTPKKRKNGDEESDELTNESPKKKGTAAGGKTKGKVEAKCDSDEDANAAADDNEAGEILEPVSPAKKKTTTRAKGTTGKEVSADDGAAAATGDGETAAAKSPVKKKPGRKPAVKKDTTPVPEDADGDEILVSAHVNSPTPDEKPEAHKANAKTADAEGVASGSADANETKEKKAGRKTKAAGKTTPEPAVEDEAE